MDAPLPSLTVEPETSAQLDRIETQQAQILALLTQLANEFEKYRYLLPAEGSLTGRLAARQARKEHARHGNSTPQIPNPFGLPAGPR